MKQKNNNAMIDNKIEYLPWDSDFFQKKIGQVFVDNSDNIINILEKAKKTNFQLIYLFGNNNFFVDKEVLKQFNGKLVDIKVLFGKNLDINKNQTFVDLEYKSNILTFDLEQLAYISGEYSRFKLDNNFQKDDFYRMYKIWIENSVKHKIADKVFVIKENDAIKGMITLKILNTKGHIGLIATALDSQGKGYGKMLISACENELVSRGIFKLEVPTQLHNSAIKFYEKCDFLIEKVTNIYHFWL